jgi:hypothetical protein
MSHRSWCAITHDRPCNCGAELKPLPTELCDNCGASDVWLQPHVYPECLHELRCHGCGNVMDSPS